MSTRFQLFSPIELTSFSEPSTFSNVVIFTFVNFSIGVSFINWIYQSPNLWTYLSNLTPNTGLKLTTLRSTVACPADWACQCPAIPQFKRHLVRDCRKLWLSSSSPLPKSGISITPTSKEAEIGRTEVYDQRKQFCWPIKKINPHSPCRYKIHKNKKVRPTENYLFDKVPMV